MFQLLYCRQPYENNFSRDTRKLVIEVSLVCKSKRLLSIHSDNQISLCLNDLHFIFNLKVSLY